jgi:pimeloyl-ACP methyl ester carboxylesterase
MSPLELLRQKECWMIYFNGFSLKGEEAFFKEKLVENDFTVAGFSYGAQKAFEYVYHTSNRIDRLILLSPAFFQNHKSSFIRTQLRYFKANEEKYRENFLNNVAYPSHISLYNHLDVGKYEDLESLLSYRWEREKVLELLERGLIIEVFMGTEDKIVDSQKSHDFFSELTTVYLLKGVGHLLT